MTRRRPCTDRYGIRCSLWGWTGKGQVLHFPPSNSLTKPSQNPGPGKPDSMTFCRKVKGKYTEKDRELVCIHVESRKGKRPKLLFTHHAKPLQGRQQGRPFYISSTLSKAITRRAGGQAGGNHNVGKACRKAERNSWQPLGHSRVANSYSCEDIRRRPRL